MNTDDEFMQRLRATFELEAGEHLHTIATALLELEREPEPGVQRRLVESIFRAAHSLKGAARAVDLSEVEARCQMLEDTFAAWKRQSRVPPSALDPIHRTLDAISAAIPRTPRGHGVTPLAPPAPPPVVAARADAARRTPEAQAVAVEETVRVAVSKLHGRLIDAEEMLVAKLTARRRADDLRDLLAELRAWSTKWAAVEPDARGLRQATGSTMPSDAAGRPRLAPVLDFLEWHVQHMKSLQARIAAVTAAADQDREQVSRLVDHLLDGSKGLLLQPFGSLAAGFPKLVRDLCRDLGREADLVVRGEEVEIDRRILEEMKDPLVHLLRNAIDHGLEPPADRVRAGKPSRGTITLAAVQTSAATVEISVGDDGRGVDVEEVKASAVRSGLVPAEAAQDLGPETAQALIFESEVSTSRSLTVLSGRGLGLAIVREKAEHLGGSVSVESQLGRGTRFAIVLPSTLATFRGMIVEAARRPFILPTLHVQRVVCVKSSEIHTIEGCDAITLEGRAVALVRLADVLALTAGEAPAGAGEATVAVVLGTNSHRVAFSVDGVIDEQEILVKPFRRPLVRVRNVAGATVLGSGEVVPILHAGDLLKSARTAHAQVVRAGEPAAPAAKSILLAEDSITSRMLIKGILESAGYRVRTAVDGREALAILREERFDLLVSDVEMPNLNGFDLTAAVRADAALAELPVVLVTALDSREDRARGVEAGADAYIVKASFDESSLLDAVRRLV